ncbi:MBL fold metallo-hydrolase [Paenibacillus turpanensis]|uniref:MBL fold metallo-hydrolase n=1 Tax=Paenibacillus turpanensis TaxID=2689078 RepID=UPI00140E611C|nr:MBL fold metallo-hydrolase [Paenibacillus turpanensis]
MSTQAQEMLSFYSGLNTIGGVHIVYGSGDAGFVFDFGLAMRGFFTEQVKTNPPHGIRHHLLTRSAPPLLNLYEEEAMEGITLDTLKQVWNQPELPQYETVSVFVSHIHQDHMALLPYLREGIKVYMSRDAYSVYKAIIAAGEVPGTKADIIALDDLETIALPGFPEGDRFQIVEVDHDSPGCSGFLLHTADGRSIGFTADWRRHGRHAYRMDRFAQMCRDQQVDLLITEGTTLRADTVFRRPAQRLETDVAAVYANVMNDAPGLVYLNILARNVERVADIIMAAMACGRTLVMDESTAAVWHVAVTEGIRALEDHPALEAAREVVRVLPTATTLPVDPAVELPFATVTLEQITSDKRAYTVYLPYYQLPLMAELECFGDRSTRSHYVHADGGPLTPSDETLHRWLTEFGVQYHYCATGGHAAPQDITALIQAAAPRQVIPLHSVHPSLCDSAGIARYFPVYGETVVLDQLIGARPSAATGSIR